MSEQAAEGSRAGVSFAKGTVGGARLCESSLQLHNEAIVPRQSFLPSVLFGAVSCLFGCVLCPLWPGAGASPRMDARLLPGHPWAPSKKKPF